MPPEEIYAAGESGRGLTILPQNGEYDPGITAEVDKAIRHMDIVKKNVLDQATLLKVSAGVNFQVMDHAGGPQRFRAYVAPANDDGIAEELKDSALLKAALSRQGK